MSRILPGVEITISGFSNNSASCFLIDDPPITVQEVILGIKNFQRFSNIEAH